MQNEDMVMSVNDSIYMVDDDPAYRERVRRLAATMGLRFRAFGYAEEFLEASVDGTMGCLLLDARLPDMSGLELLERFNAVENLTPTIIVSAYADVTMAVRAFKVGAFDFIQKSMDEHELSTSIRRAFGQHKRIWSRLKKIESYRSRYAELTSREREVCHLLVAGFLNKQIARKLTISERTVETHRANIMKKTGADSFSELIRLCIELGERPEPQRSGPVRLVAEA